MDLPIDSRCQLHLYQLLLKVVLALDKEERESERNTIFTKRYKLIKVASQPI